MSLATLLGICALPVSPEPSLAQSPRSDAIRERLKTRPDDPTLYYYLAAAAFAEGDKAGGLEALDRVARTAKGFLPTRGLGFEAVLDDPAFQEIRGRLLKKLPRVIDAREMFRLDKRLIPEGIAYDPRSRSYFVGSIAAAKIVRVDSTLTVSDLSRPGQLRQVLGLAVDPSRRRLHAVSTSLVSGAADTAINRVVTYDIDSGALVRSVDVPGAGQLNDVTIAAGGDLYVTDSGQGGVFHVLAESAKAETLVAPGRLPGVNGIALSADGAALYLAHATGIARLELATRELLPRIEIPRDETVAAIDGLYSDGRALIGVQNVTNPGRVIRIQLRPDGRGVDRVETLLSHHHPAIDEPTTGAIVGNSFALLATTQVSRFTPQGIESPELLKKPVVLLIPLTTKPASASE